MAWGDLTNSQMVSFTDAQGSGFALQSGQSSVTSNQCMTKSEVLAKYVINASTISSYSSNQLVPKGLWKPVSYAFKVAGLTSTTNTGACAIAFDPILDFTLYSSQSVPSISWEPLYTDPGLVTRFVGDGQWYKFSVPGVGNVAYTITFTGVISNSAPC